MALPALHAFSHAKTYSMLPLRGLSQLRGTLQGGPRAAVDGDYQRVAIRRFLDGRNFQA